MRYPIVMKCFLVVASLALFIAGSAAGADRVIGYESGDIAETVDGAAVSWQRISGSSNPYPEGIHIGVSSAMAKTGTNSAVIAAYWKESNGELVYRVTTRSTKVSFYYLLAVGTLDGHQGYYYFSVDGVQRLGGRVPAVKYDDGGTGWLYFEVTGLTDEQHTFEWKLVDRDYYTSCWYFWDDVTFDALPIQVIIDIKPGSDPNPLNLGSEGVVPVAVLGAADFDVREVNQESLEFEGNAARRKGRKEKIGSFSDVNGDGFDDLVVQFPAEGLELTEFDVTATVTGALNDGTPIEGTDSIVIVPPQ